MAQMMAYHVPRLAFWMSVVGVPAGFALLVVHVVTMKSLLSHVRRNHYAEWTERIGAPHLLTMGFNLASVHQVIYFLFSNESFFDPDVARRKKEARTWFSVFYTFMTGFGFFWWGAVMFLFGMRSAAP